MTTPLPGTTHLLTGWLCVPLALVAQDPARSIALESPLDYQIFQRQSKLRGTLVLRGQVKASQCDSLRVRVTGNSIRGQLPPSWRTLPVIGCSFQASLEVTAGGWYRIELVAMSGTNTSAETAVEHVAIGEVFVVSGQSNSTNYGESPQQTVSGKVSSFSGSEWRIADDPQPGVQDRSEGGSFLPAFGDAMYQRLKVPIGVASVGYGGTSVRQWLPSGDRFNSPPTAVKFFKQAGPGVWESDGTLFEGMLQRILQLGSHGFRALLWHQGESDAKQQEGHNLTPEEYRRLMQRLIDESRSRAGWNFPWFVAQATYHTPADPSYPPIREAQRSLWTDGIALEGPDTDSLTEDNRNENGKGVHLSAKGLNAHGRMWADKVGSYIENQ